jgi:ABC-type glutathione transport system ATPase component
MFDGQDILQASPAEMRALRRRMQIVFQDPASALDPRQRVGAALIEPLGVHGIATGKEARQGRRDSRRGRPADQTRLIVIRMNSPAASASASASPARCRSNPT